MTDGPLIHRLTISDIGHMRALNALFGRAFDDPETYGAQPPSDVYMGRLLAKEHVIALAAFVEGTVVGGVVAYELDKFERERREIYIYDLAVGSGYRRQGIASALLQRLGKIAAERGAWVIYVQANSGDAPAIELYTQFGVAQDVVHFDMDVPGKS